MGATLVLTLLPAMTAATDSPSPLTTAAVSTAYAVGFGGFLVLGARLADTWGHVRALVGAVLLFAASGGLLVVTSSAGVMAAARAAQGVAAAVMVPAALALITETVPEGPARRRAMAAWGATSAIGGASGFLVGSAAAAAGWWRAAFLLQAALALGLAALAAALLRTPRDTRRPSPLEQRGSLDIAGGLLITITLGLVVAGTSLLTTQLALATGLLLGAAAAGLAAVGVERRATTPVLELRTLTAPEVRAGSGVAFVNTATTSSSATLLALALQSTGGAGAAATGLTMLPFSVAVVGGSGVAPWLMTRLGDRRASAVGLIAIGVGTGLLPLAAGGLWVIAAGMAVSGAGIGVSAAASTHLGTSGPGDDSAAAAALLNTSAQLGTALGVAASLAAAQLVGTAGVWWCLTMLALVAAAQTGRTRRPGA